MSSDDGSRPPLRVGGWVPPYRSTGTGPAPDAVLLPTDVVTPPPGEFAGPAATRDGRRRKLVVAGAALAVLGVTGLAVAETTSPSNAGTPRFVSLPTIPALPPFPVAPPSTTPTDDPQRIGGSAVASKLAHSASTSASAPASSAPASSKPAPGTATSRPPAATTKPAPTTKPAAPAPPAAPARRGPFTVGATTSLEVAGQDGRRLRHRDYRARIDRISSALDRADSRFVVRAGLADPACVSFESTNYPGMFLRHRDSQVWLDTRRGSDLYAADATFCVVERRDGTLLLRSHNYPDHYLQVRRSGVDLGSRGTAFRAR